MCIIGVTECKGSGASEPSRGVDGSLAGNSERDTEARAHVDRSAVRGPPWAATMAGPTRSRRPAETADEADSAPREHEDAGGGDRKDRGSDGEQAGTPRDDTDDRQQRGGRLPPGREACERIVRTDEHRG